MQIGEQDGSGPEGLELVRLRLFDLDDQFRPPPNLGRLLRQVGAGGGVVAVGDERALPGPGLDQHGVAVVDQRLHSGRGEGHPSFIGFGFPNQPDSHHRPLPATGRSSIVFSRFIFSPPSLGPPVGAEVAGRRARMG